MFEPGGVEMTEMLTMQRLLQTGIYPCRCANYTRRRWCGDTLLQRFALIPISYLMLRRGESLDSNHPGRTRTGAISIILWMLTWSSPSRKPSIHFGGWALD